MLVWDLRTKLTVGILAIATVAVAGPEAVGAAGESNSLGQFGVAGACVAAVVWILRWCLGELRESRIAAQELAREHIEATTKHTAAMESWAAEARRLSSAVEKCGK